MKDEIKIIRFDKPASQQESAGKGWRFTYAFVAAPGLALPAHQSASHHQTR
jgi:hypothetical protein